MPYINIYFTYNDQKNIHNKEYENRQSCVKMEIFKVFQKINKY